MKSRLKILFLFSLVISLFTLSAAQELSRRKCDEYSRKNEALPESNEYRKYMDKFVIAKTLFKEYDAVLISEEYALTSTPASSSLQFIAIIVNNHSIEVASQEEQDGIYLIKLRYNIELYHKIVCLWYREELPDGYNFFTVVHEAGIRDIPFLRTYSPYLNCPLVRSDSDTLRDNFCLRYENGRDSETVFQNPTASSLVFLKSFQNDAGLNKNHYIMGVVKQQADIVYGRKIWPNLQWIERIVWKGTSGNINIPLVEPECGTITVVDSSKLLISNSTQTYRGEFPWQVALFSRDGLTEVYKCGGSLLNRDTVLTAAHCVTNNAGQIYQPARYIVKLGLFNLDGTAASPQSISVHQFIINDLYDVLTYDSDIAIIKLGNLVKYDNYIRPICLVNNVQLFDNNEGIVAGWGLNEKNQQKNEQRKGTLTIPTSRECRTQATDYIKELLTEVNYCARNKNGQNVCYGDSGSGMTAQSNNRWFVRGVVSYGGVSDGMDRFCDPNVFSLFTNATYYYDWIISNM